LEAPQAGRDASGTILTVDSCYEINNQPALPDDGSKVVFNCGQSLMAVRGRRYARWELMVGVSIRWMGEEEEEIGELVNGEW
jgi:hypothetical protein